MSQDLERPILLAEDSQDDEILLKLVLQKARVVNPIIVVRTGEEAIAQLQQPQHGDQLQRLPRIAFLDVRMPGKDGLYVLKWIKQQAHLKGLITVILSHYGEIGTVKTAYELGAYSFLSKPFLLRDLEHLMRHTKPFWKTAADTPECASQ